mgnify:FL=1
MADIELEAEGGIEALAMLSALAAHAVPGVEAQDSAEGRHTRLVRTSAGERPVTVTIGDEGVTVSSEAGPEEQREINGVVRRWLDLDRDLSPVVEALSGDPVTGPLVEARPGLRIVGYPDGFEAAVMTVLGQQVSLAAGRTFGGRLTAAFGRCGPEGLTAFPSPGDLAGLSVEGVQAEVGLTGSRARTVTAVARAFEGGLRLDPEQDPVIARAELLAIPGVGPWTAECLAVRVLRDPDAFPAGDLVLRRALGGITTAEAAAMSVRWKPWRAYALFHLWTATSY